MADEETPLLDEENFEDSGGAGGGEGEKQDNTVYVSIQHLLTIHH